MPKSVGKALVDGLLAVTDIAAHAYIFSISGNDSLMTPAERQSLTQILSDVEQRLATLQSLIEQNAFSRGTPEGDGIELMHRQFTVLRKVVLKLKESNGNFNPDEWKNQWEVPLDSLESYLEDVERYKKDYSLYNQIRIVGERRPVFQQYLIDEYTEQRSEIDRVITMISGVTKEIRSRSPVAQRRTERPGR